MIDHDPQCPLRYRREPTETCIECAHIARVRADERERIAQAIEAKREERWNSVNDDDVDMPGHEEGMEFAFRIAARIARKGSNNDNG